MPYTQENRLIAVDTPLGENVLLLQGFTGFEGISRPFNFSLDLLSEKDDIAFADIVGQRVAITIKLADDKERYLNGFVSRFAQTGKDTRFTYYRAEVVPWLWFLTRTADCRIFQNMTIPDVITKIFKDLGFTDFKLKLQGSFEPRDYCVQYRETDFNFVSRLMEQYGIHYFFEHEQKKHTLVLANTPDAHQPCPHQPQARYAHGEGALWGEDVITDCQVEQEFRPGKYALTDYNFETPSTSLLTTVDTAAPVGGNTRFEIYDYPGEYLKRPDGEQLVKLRMQEEEAMHRVLSGASVCRDFTSGYRFELQDHYNASFNGPLVLVEVQHNASAGDYATAAEGAGSYANHFTCIPWAVPYRPQRITPRPFVQGVQTAVVVGAAGEDIFTDKYGRVKVQFHWDREGKKNENSSCWVRVSHPWAGKGWGAMQVPRIGQEVIVDFLEGDPDQPIITGRVYNAEQTPPWDLPANKTQSGIQSRVTKGGSPTNFNELRFEDKKGSEEILLHAEKDWKIDVKNNKNETAGASISSSAGGSISRSAGANHSRTANKNITDKAGVDITTESGKNMSLKAGGAYQLHTNLGIHLKAMNFVAALIESGAKAAAETLKKGYAHTAVAAAAAGGQAAVTGGDGGGAALAQGTSGLQTTGAQALAALSPGIEAGAAEITRLSNNAAAGMTKLEGPVNNTIAKADALGKAIESGASPEAIADAFMAMAGAAMESIKGAKEIVEGLLPQIPSIVLWAMKDISATALWSMSLQTKVKNISIEAKNKDINIKAKQNLSLEAKDKNMDVKAKQNLNLEAQDKDLNIKAGKKNVQITGKEKVSVKAEDKDLVIEAGQTKVFVKAAKQIFLKCGSASISLSENGNIVINGAKINIKGSEPVQVKGTPIKLN